jgi:N-hydroxyarylamine O-acetyltransferase
MSDSTPFPLAEYLRRIGRDTAPALDAAGLAAIVQAQARAIPFENIDVLLDRPPSLATADLARKLVRSRRGGYCFELNGLLHAALAAMGFAVRAEVGRVINGRPGPGGRTHRVVLVTLGAETWLADAGFGGSGPSLPLPFHAGAEIAIGEERFRLRAEAGAGMVLARRALGEWGDLYLLPQETTLPVDIECGNWFTATWPGSIFRQQLMASVCHPEGRTTLLDDTLKLFRHGSVSSRKLDGQEQLMAALDEHFGIALDATDAARLARCIGSP